MTWEKGRQLKTFDDISYEYNANGIRTAKTVGGVRHEYDLEGSNILRESDALGNVIVPLYDGEEQVCGMTYNGELFFFHKNLQGDIIAITDHTAAVVARYSYDAWGKCTILLDTSGCEIATVNPFRYRGYYYDAEIGMYYLQSRYYNTEVGRFVNSDELIFLELNRTIASYNVFGYCENNPIYYEDPSGYTIVIDDIIIFGIAFIVMMFVVVMSNLYMSTPQYRQACHNFTSLISSAYNSLLDRITMLFQSATKAVNKAIEKVLLKQEKLFRQNVMVIIIIGLLQKFHLVEKML